MSEKDSLDQEIVVGDKVTSIEYEGLWIVDEIIADEIIIIKPPDDEWIGVQDFTLTVIA